jgi:hypothetical protein
MFCPSTVNWTFPPGRFVPALTDAEKVIGVIPDTAETGVTDALIAVALKVGDVTVSDIGSEMEER